MALSPTLEGVCHSRPWEHEFPSHSLGCKPLHRVCITLANRCEGLGCNRESCSFQHCSLELWDTRGVETCGVFRKIYRELCPGLSLFRHFERNLSVFFIYKTGWGHRMEIKGHFFPCVCADSTVPHVQSGSNAHRDLSPAPKGDKVPTHIHSLTTTRWALGQTLGLS